MAAAGESRAGCQLGVIGQGDWINEAFAEYFSAVAVQKISSEADPENPLSKHGYLINLHDHLRIYLNLCAILW